MTQTVPTPTSADRFPAQPSIELIDVTVRFHVPRERIWSFKEYAIRRLRRGIVFEEFLALHDVRLEIRRGEAFGVMGNNGAGKSTLLKVIARVFRPSVGRVIVRGRVAPLLELGAAFHPDLTGRENVFLNATLLGHRRAEISEHFDRIVAFADIGEFIDAPLRTYSSGMMARLGFALATEWPPEVLLVDELLAVGDASFRAKCLERIADFRQSGVTIVVVSHDAALLRSVCDRAAWLDHGAIRAQGNVEDVGSVYAEFLAQH
jgi:lipopolysaccharide transport system ATP-binding protein